jgi:hypothetical protein
MLNDFKPGRRNFLGCAVMTIAAARFGVVVCAKAQGNYL